MNITIIDKSLRSDSTINYSAVYLKLSPDAKDDADGQKDLWITLPTVIKGGALKILLDMGKMNIIDSQGVRTIFNAHRYLKSNNGEIVILNPGEKIRQIFETLNLNKVITVFESEEDALRYLTFS